MITSTARRFTVYLALVSQLALAAACRQNTTFHGTSAEGGLVGGILARLDVGEVVYDIVHRSLAADPANGAARAAALEARHADFAGAVNAILNAKSLAGLAPTLQAIIDLTDDDTLPRLAGSVAAILEALAAEPGLPTVRAFRDLPRTRGLLGGDDALAFGARVANYPELEALLAAIADLIADDSTRTAQRDLAERLRALAARALRDAGQAPAPGAPPASPGLLDGIADELLVAAPPRAGPAPFGGPAWTVRLDAHGNPAVARDPVRGTLYPPFVDGDADGAADVNAAGEPIDGSGAAIDLSPYGTAGAAGRDADGRALAPDGRPLYVYFDAKETLLSHFLQLLGEALRRRLDLPAIALLIGLLGPRATRDAGTPFDPSDDFPGFRPDSPALDLVWGGLELMKLPELPKVLRALAEVNRRDPAFSEKLFVTYGRIVELVRPVSSGTPAVAPTAADRLTSDRTIELLGNLFNHGGGPTTGRALFQRLHDLGQTARDLPPQLALMIEYRTLAVDSAGNPIPGQSQLVDRGLPPTLPGSPWGENRSILHQLLDLFASADACQTFVFAGKPLSESLVELLAGNSVGTMTTLIGFIDFPIVRTLLSLYCPGILPSLDSTKGLAASGALAGIIPICKVFVDHGQTRLFVDLLKTADAQWATSIRESEPKMAALLRSGAIDPIFDLDDYLVAGWNGAPPLADPVTGEPAIDTIVDLLGKLLATGGANPDRSGAQQLTRLHLVLEPMRRIEEHFWITSGGSGAADWDTLYYGLTDLFVERLDNDRLKNQNVTPFLARTLDLLARNLPQDDAARAARLAEIQQSAIDGLESPDLAAIVDLTEFLKGSRTGDAVRAATANLLTPNVSAQQDIFGSLLKAVATALQVDVEAAPLRAVATFGATLFEPGRAHAVDILSGVSRLLSADRGRVVLNLLRNALNQAPPAAGLGPRVPLSVIVSVSDDVSAASAPPGATPLTPDQEAQRTADRLRDGVRFIRDPQSGLERVWRFIKTRGAG